MTYYKAFFDNNQRMIQDQHINCCRWNNLVYARTLKCGSEFFYRNFTQTAGWTPIRWDQIDWDNDRVFSYVMDPIIRRHKGISEFIVMCYAKDLLLNVPAFIDFVRQVPCLDEHSASLHTIYSNRVDYMDWLPMVSDHSVAITATNELLERHNHPPILWNTAFTHTTSNYMDEIYDRVKTLWDQAKIIKGHTRNYFEKDIELFLNAVRSYDRDHGTKFSQNI